MQMPKFDITRTNQAAEFGHDLQLAMYGKLFKWSQEGEWVVVRLLAVPVALADALIVLAVAVSTVAEDVIKGLSNIFGGVVFYDYYFLEGLKQLLLETPYDIVVHTGRLCLMPFTTLIISVNFTISPSTSIVSRIRKLGGFVQDGKK